MAYEVTVPHAKWNEETLKFERTETLLRYEDNEFQEMFFALLEGLELDEEAEVRIVHRP